MTCKALLYLDLFETDIIFLIVSLAFRDEDDYVFTASLDSAASKEGEAFLKIAKKALANKLRTKFQKFPKVNSDCFVGRDGMLAN